MSQAHHDEVTATLKAFGLGYPEAGLNRPWPEHEDLVVKGKTFAFLVAAGLPLRISCKLPYTGPEVLALPGAQPTGYGLGKHGWVTVAFDVRAKPPLARLKDWIDESYRAQAPKRLVARIGTG